MLNQKIESKNPSFFNSDFLILTHFSLFYFRWYEALYSPIKVTFVGSVLYHRNLYQRIQDSNLHNTRFPLKTTPTAAAYPVVYRFPDRQTIRYRQTVCP